MLEYFKLNILLLISVIFGPLLAIYLSFYNDIYTLSKKYKFLEYISDEWELLGLFLLFWMSIYCALTSWQICKRIFNKPPKLEWWQTETIYQIYVKSFFDSNNDGVGDLRGIIDKLDYIESLGVKSIWLNPIYPSGGKDGGYDIVSFVDIDPIYGTMKDFEELVDQVHQRGMHLLMDFIPNHTSNMHKWFIESCKDDPKNKFRDYYVWVESEDSVTPPNNWKSVFGGSAWTYVKSRKAWYLHQFLPEQPDLNLRCAAVRDELEKILKFWLSEKNVDGFRVDAVKHLYESETLENEPLLIPDKFSSIHDEKIRYDDLNHIYTANQIETYGLLYSWRRLCDDISKSKKSVKALIVEATYDAEDIQYYYWFENKENAHFAFNFQLCFLSERLFKKNEAGQDNDRSFKPKRLKHLIEEYQSYLPKGCWANWQLGNHDNERVASRVGNDNVNLANALNLLLGGTAIVYYGEEIGMQNLPKELLKFEDCQDEAGKNKGPTAYLEHTRDFERTPMQWDDSKNSGFSKSNKTWLPINPNFTKYNVKLQTSDKRSTLNIFRNLISLRQHPSFQYGSLKIHFINDQIFSFIRKAFGSDVFLICMNLSDSNSNANLLINNEIAPRAYVAVYIPGSVTNNDDVDLEEKYQVKAAVFTKNIFLKPKDILILTWPTSD